MAPVKKKEFDNQLKERMQALNLSVNELSEISGYKTKTIYNVSGNHQPLTAQLNAYLKLLEVLKKRNELESIIKELKALG